MGKSSFEDINGRRIYFPTFFLTFPKRSNLFHINKEGSLHFLSSNVTPRHSMRKQKNKRPNAYSLTHTDGVNRFRMVPTGPSCHPALLNSKESVPRHLFTPSLYKYPHSVFLFLKCQARTSPFPSHTISKNSISSSHALCSAKSNRKLNPI